MTVKDSDKFSTNVVVATLFNPTGIDYNPNNNSLIVSVNWPDGAANNFVRIDATRTISAWTAISNMVDETKIAAVKVSTNGFTAGDRSAGPRPAAPALTPTGRSCRVKRTCTAGRCMWTRAGRSATT